MAIKRVIAHWSGTAAPGVSPFPPVLAGYPGAPPTNVGPPPTLPAPPGVVLYDLWCELAAEADITALDWMGPGWPGPPPPIPDQGYAAPATGFQVFGVRAVTIAGAIGSTFEFTLYPPGGQPPITLSPPTYQAAIAPAFQGRGIWRIEVGFAPGGPGSTASSLHLGPAPVAEPFFGPYGPAVESILAIEFEGRDTTTTTTTSSTTTTTTTTTTTSSTTTPAPDCYDVQLSFPAPPCAPGTATVSVTFTATVTPLGTAPPYTGSYQWKIKKKTQAGTWATVLQVTQASNQLTAPLGKGDYDVAVVINTPNCPDGPSAFDNQPFTILDCNCPTFTGVLTATPAANPCTWTFSAAVNNPQNHTLSFDWDFGDGTTATTSSPSATHTYTSSGQRTVTVTVHSAQEPRCEDALSKTIAVDCNGGTNTTPTTPTTSGTTSTTTTTTTTTTTSTTTSAPSGGGCLCLLLLILALIMIAAASALLFAWACGGFGNLALLLVGISAAVLGAILLALWALFCFDCASLLVLLSFFRVLIVALALAAGVLALLGLGNCAIGALIVAGFFAALVAMLFSIGQATGCIRTGP
jgi:hypothetical protein